MAPDDWQAFQDYCSGQGLNPPAPPGATVASENVAVETVAAAGHEDGPAETRVGLERFLVGGVGHLLVAVEPMKCFTPA